MVSSRTNLTTDFKLVVTTRFISFLASVLVVLSTSVITASERQLAFREVAAKSGVEFQHQSGAIGRRWTVEITGAGVGVLDFDGDGLLDIWAIQGGPLLDRSGELPRDRIFRNVSEYQNLQFIDVTDEVGVTAAEYGMGIVAGDIDNDGDTDVVLLNFGRNQLFRNDAGQFTEVADSVLSIGNEWSLSGSFADFNGDGYLDLYVANYMEFPPLKDYRVCRRMSTRIGYCAPSNFEPTPDRLYLNKGDGSFIDISAKSGIQSLRQRGMGVVVDDLNADGTPDIYVANDMAMNFLWLNQGNETFSDDALYSGVAVNAHGLREASMGVAIGDWDRDFDPDLLLTHDVKESNTLYVYEHTGWFSDQSVQTGIAAPSMSKTGFGVGFFDAENDGDLDVFIANGSVSMIDSQRAQRIEPPLRQTNQLFLNDGNGRFIEDSSTTLSEFEEVSRGAAFGDFDNDGDVDVVVSNNEGPIRIHQNLSNDGQKGDHHWLGLRVMQGRRDAIGAIVWLDGEEMERKVVRTDGSYASANEPRLLFGLGADSKHQTVHIQWSDGTRTSFDDLEVDSYHKLQHFSN